MSLAAERSWVQSLNERSPRDIVLGIVEIESGRLVGNVGIDRIDWRNRNGVAGMMIGDTAAQEKGYGTEATMLALRYAFWTLGLHKVLAEARGDNVRSIRMQQRCGFRTVGTMRGQFFYEGQFVDCVLLEILRDEWEEALEAYQNRETE